MSSSAREDNPMFIIQNDELSYILPDSELQIEFVTLVPAKPRSVRKIDTAL